MSTARALEESAVLITGGTSGVGLAAARKFAEVGVPQIAIVGRNPERGEQASSSLKQKHPKTDIFFIAADAHVASEASRIAASACARFGRIDVLLNSTVGPYGPTLLHNTPIEEIQPMLLGQIMGPLLMSRAVLPVMRESGGGVILNISSDAGKLATPGESVIGAAMAGIVMFSRTLAIEAKRDGIRVNALTPSLIDGTLTQKRMMQDTFATKLFEKARVAASLGVVVPEDMAELIVFLSSPQAARITGQAISLNGGISAALTWRGSSNLNRLSGRRAIVTGGGSGIGRASALRFAQEGAHVFVVGRTPDTLDETVEMIRQAGGTAARFVADVTIDESVAEAVTRCVEETGGLEVFYANAGCAEKTSSFFDLSVEDWEQVFRGNVVSSFLAVKHAGRHMGSKGRGSIILMSSAGSLRGNGGPFAYCAAKASVNYIAQGAANILAGTNVRVNVILSGLVETNMTRATFDQARARGVENKIGHITPLKRAGTPEEIAAVAAFLASDDSAFVDGQMIAADGGFSSTHPYGRVSV